MARHCRSTEAGDYSTPTTRAPLSNCNNTICPCLGLTPATERWDGRPSHVSQPRHPPHPHPRSVDTVSGAIFCTDQRSIVGAQYLRTNPEPVPCRRIVPVTCRPADPAGRPVDLHAKQQKSLPAVIYFDRLSHREFGVAKEELDILIKSLF